jgi:hypothetical protein
VLCGSGSTQQHGILPYRECAIVVLKTKTSFWKMRGLATIVLTALVMIACSSLVVVPCTARTVTGTMHSVSNHFTKIAKFSFRPVGTSTITGVLRYRGAEARGAVYLFMDTEWGVLPSCARSCVALTSAYRGLSRSDRCVYQTLKGVS